MPRVSVIIPAFNAEAHIAETLRSVGAQTYDDWEVVLADDRSTDATVEIATKFGERVKIVRSAKNAGPSAARNLGIAHASGELLAFLDADDYWLPAYLEHQVGLFDESRQARLNVGIVACNALVLGPQGFLTRTYGDYIGHPKKVTLARLLASNPIFVSALSPRAVVDEAGGFCPGMLAEDHDLWLRIVELGYRVVATRSPLAVHRLSSGSMSADPAKMARASQRVYRRALERGNLSARERRVARRELRGQRAVERIASADGISYRQILKALPLVALVAVEHPKRWRSFARAAVRGHLGFDRFAL